MYFVLCQDAIGREVARGHMCVIDDRCTMIGLYMYEGLFKVIPVPLSSPSAPAAEAFNVKFVCELVCSVEHAQYVHVAVGTFITVT